MSLPSEQLFSEMRGRKQQFAYSGRKRCIFLVEKLPFKKVPVDCQDTHYFFSFFTETQISRDNKAPFFGFLREY